MVAPTSLRFDALTPSHDVELSALADADPGNATLHASVAPGHGLPDTNAIFVDAAGLRVNVVGMRRFAWVFRSAATDEELSEIVVLADTVARLVVSPDNVARVTTALRLSLEGDAGARLEENERLEVSLLVPSGMTVSPSMLMVSADHLTEALSVSAELGAMPGELRLQVTSRTPPDFPRTQLADMASLPVRVVREFALSFETPAGEPLSMLRVTVGGITGVGVTVRLANADLLLPGEEMRVRLSPNTVSSAPEPTLTVDRPSMTFFVNAAYEASTLSGSVAAAGSVETVGVAVENTRVFGPALLPVEILPREFALVFTPSAIGISRDESGTVPVTLTLVDAALLPETVEVSVELFSTLESGPAPGSIFTNPENLTFGASRPAHTVGLRVLNPRGEAELTMHAEVLEDPGLPNAIFVNGALPMDVGVHALEWVFRSSRTGAVLTRAIALMGRSTALLVSLETPTGGGLLPGETVSVSLTAPTRMTVTPSRFELSGAVRTSQSVTLTAKFPVDSGELRLTVEAMTLTPLTPAPPQMAVLPVDAVRELRIEWQLRDNARGITVRRAEGEELRVLAGARVGVFAWFVSEDLRLVDVSEERVRFLNRDDFAANADTGDYVIPPDFILMSGGLSTSDFDILVPLDMATDSLSLAIARPLDYLQLDPDIPTRLALPPPLPVEVVAPRRFRISLGVPLSSLVPATVGRSADTDLPILSKGLNNNMRFNVPEDIMIDSATLRLVISYPRMRVLSINVFGPGGFARAVFESGDRHGVYLDETFTLAVPPGMRSRGRWTLLFFPSSSFSGETGALERFELELAGFASGVGSAVSVIAGEPVRLVMRLLSREPPPDVLGVMSLVPGERLMVDLVYDGPRVGAPPVRFAGESAESERNVEVATSPTATSGTLRAVVRDELANAEIVSPETVAIRVIEPGSLSLAWLTAEGTPLSRLRVVANTTTMVSAALGIRALERVRVAGSASTELRAVLLSAGLQIGELQVGFSYEPPAGGVEVAPAQVTFAAGGTRVEVELHVALTAESGTLTAVVTNSPEGLTTPTSVTLEVEVSPREIALSFATRGGEALSQARVLAGGATEVAVALKNPESLLPGEVVVVRLSMTTAVRILGPPEVVLEPGAERSVFFVEVAHDVPPSGNVTAFGGVRSGFSPGISPGTTVVGTQVIPSVLPIAVVARSFELSVRDEVSAPLSVLRLSAGGSARLTVRVSGVGTALGFSSLSTDETPTLDFVREGGVAPGMGISLSQSPGRVVSASFATIAVALGASSIAQSGTLTIILAGLVNASAEPLPLPVEILPREPVEFTLSFATPHGDPLESAQVLAGGSTAVAVVLDNPALLLAGEELRVTLSAMTLTTDVPELTLTADVSSATVFIAAAHDVASLSGEVAITGEVRMGESAVGSVQVTGATLGVAVAERVFSLGVGDAGLSPRVPAAGSAQATVSVGGVETALGLSSLFAGETLTVGLSYDGTGVSLSPLSLTPDRDAAPGARAELTLTATLLATSGRLVATGSGLVNARVNGFSVAVEITPRAFALAFAPPEIGILAGTSETVTLTLPDASLLPETVEVTVELNLSGDSTLTVMPASLRLSAATPSDTVELSVMMGVGAGSATLHASVASGHGLPDANAVFVDAELLVNVIDVRRFEWVFRSAATDEALSEIIALTDSTTALTVSLEGVGGARLRAGERVDVELLATPSADITVSPPALALTAANPTRAVSLTADADAMTGSMAGELRLNVTGTEPDPLAAVEPGVTLPVRVLRNLPLRFGVVPGGSADLIARTRVLAGNSTERVVVVLNEDLLLANELVVVALSTMTVAVVPNVLLLARDMPRATFTIDAARDVRSLSGTVAARGWVLKDGAGGALMDARVIPASLSVEILPRRFALSFTTPEGGPLSSARVLAGGTTAVRVALENPALLLADERVEVVFSMRTVAVGLDALRLTADASSETVVIAAAHDVASLSGEVGASGEVLRSGGVVVMHTEVESASLLPVTILERVFDLSVEDEAGFPLSAVRVAAGRTTPLVFVLSGVETKLGLSSLFANETPAFDLVYTGGTGVSLSPSRVPFSAHNSTAAVVLSATSIARDGALEIIFDRAGAANMSVAAPVSLPVAVLPREFVELRLLFATPRGKPLGSAQVLQVLAGGATEVAVVLENPELLLIGEVVRVTLSTITVTADASQRMLTAQAPRAVFTIEAAYDKEALSGLLGASGEVHVGGVAVENTRVTRAFLPVAIHARLFRLSVLNEVGFTLSVVRVPVGVPVGKTTRVTVRVSGKRTVLGLPSLFAGETLTVDLFHDGTGVRLLPSRVSLTADRDGASVVDAVVTLDTAPDAVGGALALDVIGSLVNARVESISLPVEILPREFVLSFATPHGDPLSLARVLAGGATEVAVVLETPELLLTGEELRVTLSALMVTADRSELTLSAATTSVAFGIAAAYDVTSMSATVEMSGEVRAGGVGVENTVVLRSFLEVAIVARPFRLSVVDRFGFPVSSIRMRAVETTWLTVRVLGEETVSGSSLLFAGETLVVDLSYGGIGMVLSPSPLLLTADRDGAPSANATLTLIAAPFATSDTLTMSGGGLVNARVEPAPLSLDVEILPAAPVTREFALSFVTPDGEPLLMQRVLADGVTEVAVTLDSSVLLFADEELRLTLSTRVVTVDRSNLTLTADAPRAVFTIGAVYAVASLSGEVMASGEVRSVGGNRDAVVEYTRVLPVALPVEVVAREFRVGLAILTFDRRVYPHVGLSNGISVESGIEVPIGGNLESLELSINLSDTAGSYAIDLFLPTGAVVLLDTRVFSSSNVEVVYSSADHPGLQSLLGTPARGEWRLEMTNTTQEGGSTWGEWALSLTVLPERDIDVLRVSPGDSTLSAVLPELVLPAGEELSVSFDYLEGAGVSLSPAVFSGGNTAVEVGLDVQAAATPGRLRANSATLGRSARVTPHRVEVLPREVFLRWEGASGVFPGRSTESFVEILAGRSTDAMLVLLNPQVLLPGEAVFVRSFDGGGVSFTGVVLTPDAPDAMVRIDVSPDAVSHPGIVPDAEVSINNVSVRTRPLAVEVGVREFELVLDAPVISGDRVVRLTAGASMQVTVRLQGRLFAGETLTVDRLFYGGEGVTVQPFPFPFTADSIAVDLILTAAAGATGGFLAIFGPVQPGLQFIPSSAGVRVIIVPREFPLVFTPPEIGILTGTTETVTLTLTDVSLFSEAAEVRVELNLNLSGATTLTVVPTVVSLGASTPSHVVELSASADVDVGAGSLRTLRFPLSNHPLPNADIIEGVLLVSVVDTREFEWVFRSPERGKVVSEAVVAATEAGGATTRLLVSLEGVVGARLKAGEGVEVSLTATPGLRVSPAVLLVDRDNLTQMVSLFADVDVVDGELLLRVTQTQPAPLPRATVMDMKRLPVRGVRSFVVSFETPDGTPLSRARVPAGSSTEVTLKLENPELLRVGEERVRVAFVGNKVTVDGEIMGQLVLGINRPSREITIDAAYDVAPLVGSLEISGVVRMIGVGGNAGVVANTRVVPFILPIEILPRVFALSFVTPGGEPLSLARVLAGGSKEVAVALDNPGLLLAGEEVLAMVTVGAGMSELSMSELRLTADMPSTGLTIEVAYDVVSLSPGRVDVSAQVLAGGVEVVNTRVAPLSLPVEIVARRFDVSLVAVSTTRREAISGAGIPQNTMRQTVNSPIYMSADVTVRSLSVGVKITHGRIGDLLVTLIAPGGSEAVLHSRTGGNNRNIDATYTGRDLTLLAGTGAQGTWILTVGDYRIGTTGRLDGWSLDIFYDVPLPHGVRVFAGLTTQVTMVLSGVKTALGVSSLFAGDRLTIDFDYGGGTGVSLLSPSLLVGGNEVPSASTAVTLVAAPDATDGTLVMGGSGLVNAVVEPATLPVRVFDSRMFEWVFRDADSGEELSELRLFAGDDPGSVRISLEGMEGDADAAPRRWRKGGNSAICHRRSCNAVTAYIERRTDVAAGGIAGASRFDHDPPECAGGANDTDGVAACDFTG